MFVTTLFIKTLVARLFIKTLVARLFIKTTGWYVLAYTFAHKKQERGEQEGRRSSIQCRVSRALPALVMCCKCTKPCDIKSFYVGSVFHLDAGLLVSMKGCNWCVWQGSLHN